MRKRAIAGAGVFALLFCLVLAQAALAAPKGEQSNSKGGKPTMKRTDSSSNIREHKVTLCHKGRLITVDEHAVSAHLKHGDEVVGDGAEREQEQGESDEDANQNDNGVTGDAAEPEQSDIEPDDCTKDQSPEQETSEGSDEEETSDAQPEEDQPEDSLDDSNATEPKTGRSGREGESEQQNSLIETRTCDGGEIELRPEERRTFDLHNKTRRSHGIKPLCVDPTLTKAARAHSNEMIVKDYFAHASFNGTFLGERLDRSGYSWRTVGENIARGAGPSSMPDDRFKAWMESKGHRKNILNDDFREVGIGSVTGDFKEQGRQTMYTVDFGTREQP